MRPRQIPAEEIRFAAKMGFLTKEIWDEYFGTESRSWRSRQWRALLEEKFFLPHPSAIAKDVIIPNAGHKTVQQLVGHEVLPLRVFVVTNRKTTPERFQSAQVLRILELKDEEVFGRSADRNQRLEIELSVFI